MPRIILTGGGTAGHVLPNLALIPELSKHFEIHYIGRPAGIEHELIKNYNKTHSTKPLGGIIHYHPVRATKLRRSLTPKNLLSNSLIPFTLADGIKQAKKILKLLRPSLVFSKGGFAALPTVLAAGMSRIPVVLHESDLSIGLANRMSVTHTTIICTTFAETKIKKGKAIHTGPIIRPQIFTGDPNSIIKMFSKHKSQSQNQQNTIPNSQVQPSKNLLVLGGSQGAAAINNALYNTLDTLIPNWNILHITGKGKLPDSPKSHPTYTPVEYIENIQDAYAWADVVISRAGAGAMFELLALQKTTIFIPLATGRGDQIENAEWVRSHGAGTILSEGDLDPHTLTTALSDTCNNREALRTNIQKLGNLDGTKKVVEILAQIP